jgi:hypothetical protein
VRCRQQTRTGNPCRNPPWSGWKPHWPEPTEPGLCWSHLDPVDKATAELWTVTNARDEPACWSWPVPDEEGQSAGRSDCVTDADDHLRNWQSARCAICGGSRKLFEDHDHDSGLVRGLLCHVCNSGENSGRRWELYRRRPPTRILGIEIRYWDPNLGDHAPNLADFRASVAGLCAEPCSRCLAPKGDRCACPPFYRLDPGKLARAMSGFVNAAAGLRVNGIRHLLQTSVRSPDSHEGQFVRDLVLLPRLDYVAGKWFGGRANVAMTTRDPKPCDGYEFLWSEDDGVILALPASAVGLIVHAVSIAGTVAWDNGDRVVQRVCLELASEFGFALVQAAVDGQAGASKIDTSVLRRVAALLNWIVERLTVHGWSSVGAEDSVPLAEVLRGQADFVERLAEQCG